MEVVVWEELFALTRRMIEAGHETESKCKKGRKREREKKKRKQTVRRKTRKRSKEWETKIVVSAAYLACLLVFSLVLQFEVAVQSHYGDTP